LKKLEIQSKKGFFLNDPTQCTSNKCEKEREKVEGGYGGKE
jgi:hypothetical protein